MSLVLPLLILLFGVQFLLFAIPPGFASSSQVYDHIQLPASNPDTFTNNAKHQYVREFPANKNYGHLVISGSSSNDPYSRLLYIYVSSQSVLPSNPTYTESVAGSFSYDLDVLSYLPTSDSNGYIWIEVTTCGSCSYSWKITSNANVGYTASNFVTQFANYFTTGEVFQSGVGAGLSQTFTSSIANGTVGPVVVHISVSTQNDPYGRLLTVTLNGAAITPGPNCPNPSGSACIVSGSWTWVSGDLTSQVKYKSTVSVKVTISNPPSSYSWAVSGWLTSNARYEVWQDTSPNWANTWHPFAEVSSSLYAYALYPSKPDFFVGTVGVVAYGVETVSGSLVGLHYGATMYIPGGGGYSGWEIGQRISVSISPSSSVVFYTPSSNASPSSSGDYTYLPIAEAIITLVQDSDALEYAIPAAIIGLLVQYYNPPGISTCGSSCGTSVWLNDNRMVGQYSAASLSDLLHAPTEFGSPGVYTVSISDQVTVLGQGPSGFAPVASQLVSLSATYRG